MEKCILIYEDDLEILKLCEIILSRPDRKIATRNCCDTIIEDISLLQPDVILMDLWVPKIGGEKAISLMKAHPETEHIPVILFSANDGIEEVCKRVEAAGYLKKPFDIVELRTIIEENIS